MKSLCIKTNDTNAIQYLLNELKNIDLEHIYFSSNQFKNYKNVIVHYCGTDNNTFFSKISSILSFLVVDNYEENFLNRLIIQNYFYFDSTERKKILDICFDVMIDDFTSTFDKKFKLLYDSFFEFISSNKVLILTGFINFRIKEYMNFLDEVVNEAVNTFIIEKEYLEFISLLKLYINATPSQCESVHLIYSNSESILLDENKNVIVMPNDNLNAKILSDISFSSNDYTLNSLLTLIPKKIHIHLLDNYIDEFINTLQLVFENRIDLCTDCDICRIYNKAIFSKK